MASQHSELVALAVNSWPTGTDLAGLRLTCNNYWNYGTKCPDVKGGYVREKPC